MSRNCVPARSDDGSETRDGCIGCGWLKPPTLEIATVPGFLRGRGEAIAHLEGGFLSKCAEHDLARDCPSQKYQVEGAEDDAVGFPRARAGDNQERAVEMPMIFSCDGLRSEKCSRMTGAMVIAVQPF